MPDRDEFRSTHIPDMQYYGLLRDVSELKGTVGEMRERLSGAQKEIADLHKEARNVLYAIITAAVAIIGTMITLNHNSTNPNTSPTTVNPSSISDPSGKVNISPSHK